MNNPNITDIVSVFDYINSNISSNGYTTIFFDVLFIPIFFVVIISCRNMNVGDNLDCLNISSFVCLMLSFVLSSINFCSFIIVGIFLALLVFGLFFKRMT